VLEAPAAAAFAGIATGALNMGWVFSELQVPPPLRRAKWLLCVNEERLEAAWCARRAIAPRPPHYCRWALIPERLAEWPQSPSPTRGTPSEGSLSPRL